MTFIGKKIKKKTKKLGHRMEPNCLKFKSPVNCKQSLKVSAKYPHANMDTHFLFTQYHKFRTHFSLTAKIELPNLDKYHEVK